MARLTWVDRLLLGAFLGVWIVIFGLHVREVVSTGLAQPPLSVSMPPDTESYPRVRGIWIEQSGDVAGLRIGDELLRVGTADLRGVGHIGFKALAIQQAGPDLAVPAEYERGGERAEVSLPLARMPIPWMRIPALAATALTAVLVLLRGGGTRQTRAFFVAFMTMVIYATPFQGGGYVQTYASNLIFYASSLVAPPLLVRWTVLFLEEAPGLSRLALGNTTNLAARLQALTRDPDAPAVIDEATWRAAGPLRGGFERRTEVRIRGLREPRDVFVARFS